MSLLQHTATINPPRRGLHVSSLSDKNVISTCLYNASTSQLDSGIDKFISTPSVASSRQNLYTSFSDTPRSIDHETGETRPGSRLRKDPKLLRNYDATTTEEEFDALPINVRRKYFSTLERLRFAECSRTGTPDDIYIHDYIQQDSRPTTSCQPSLHCGTGHNQKYYPKLRVDPQQTPSLAERRGKRLDHLIPQGMHSIEQSYQNFSLKSSSSILSFQPPLLESDESNSFSRNEHAKKVAQIRQSVQPDTLGKAIPKESPISCSNSFSPREILSPISDGRFSPHRESVGDREHRSVMRSTNWTAPKASDMYDPFDWVDNEQDSSLDLSLDDYYANFNLVSPTTTHTIKPPFQQRKSPNYSMPSNIVMSSPQSLNFEFIQTPNMKPRSRAQSFVGSSKTTRISASSPHNKVCHSKESLSSLKAISRPRQSSLVNSMNTMPTNFPKSIPILLKTHPENEDLTSDGNSSSEKKLSQPENISSEKGSDRLLIPNDNINKEVLASRKRRSYTISSTNTANFSQEHLHPSTTRPIILKKIDSPLSSGSNQMTLRMTLTRPDLRLDEAEIYAWQDSKFPCQNQYPADYIDEKFEGKGPLGGPDGWGLEEKERGVVKRFWNKMTHNKKSPIG